MVSAADILLLGVVIFYMSIVNDALTVYTHPGKVLLPRESEVLVNCTVPTSTSNVRISWEYGSNKKIPYYPASGNAPGDVYVLKNNSLYIKSVKRRNTGTYRCIASAGAERTFSDVLVTVAYLQQFLPMKTAKFFKGFEASLKCEAPLGVPVPVVSWKRNGKALTGPRFSTKAGQGNTLTLFIKNVEEADAGNYTCFAKNLGKERSIEAVLEVVVQGPVKVTPKHLAIREHQNASFQCISQSRPPLDVVWRKIEKTSKTSREKDVSGNKRIKVENGKLTVTNALPIDKGTYKCISKLNSELVTDDVSLRVQELLKVDKSRHQSVQRKDLRTNKEAKISCQFRGDEKFKVRWLKQNLKKLPGNTVANGSVLIIKKLGFSDAGNYTCIAHDSFTTVAGNIKLVVFESPEFTIKPKNTTGFVGNSAWIHCQGKGTPAPSVNYLKSDSKTKLSDLNQTHFRTLANHTLYIKKLKMEDSGAYVCWLTQSYATNISEFYLSVKEPMKKSDASTPMARTVGIAVGCAGVYILLVIGLMIYCRARRARLLKKEGEDGECLKDPLVGNEDIPLQMQNGKCLEQWQFPREELKDQVTLGRGKMGRIFTAQACIGGDCSETLVAVKEFDGKVEQYRTDFDLELEMFAQLNHVNIVRLIGVTTDMNPYYLITDYSELGDMKQYLNNTKNISNTVRLNMTFCIASGMDYLIKLHYIHRDLAARNCIPYPGNNVKVSFLSICEDLYCDDYFLLNQIPVPLRWLSPEAIQCETYSERSDVWSFGVTVWEIFSGGKRPYSDYKDEKVLDGVCKDLSLPKPDGCPQVIYDIMRKCWMTDSNKRPTFEELVSLIAETQISE